MLLHFAHENAQFVARFRSFGFETSHCDVSDAQGDAGENRLRKLPDKSKAEIVFPEHTV